MPLLQHDTRPVFSLVVLFAAWKGFLLAIALGATVGPDYDTSTSLFFERIYGNTANIAAIARRLTRWDAIYFIHIARYGYVYEQEWAFGMALPALIQRGSDFLRSWGLTADGAWEPLLGVALAHLAHLIAVLALHELTISLFNNKRLAYVTSVLYILSPAGIFLSAPYNESPFAALSLIGIFLFAWSLKFSRLSLKRNSGLLASGIVLGLATTFRSNGLANGLLFAVEVVGCLIHLTQHRSLSRMVALICPTIGGLSIAAGSLVPQTVAWMRYCHEPEAGPDMRPWCSRRIPSIYAFVQDEYWNVGFLRYWTLDQLPLFLLASPMLAILIVSSLRAFILPGLRNPRGARDAGGSLARYRIFVRALAASQAAVVVLAITTYHVQIITRLSSAYPVWYWWAADCLMDQRKTGWGRAAVVFIVMYAGIQGGLFASFLPPA